jgi:hypothetical protein
MDKKRILLKDIAKVEPFRVPEGYFERFTDDVMSQLPDAVPAEPNSISLWHRVRPWLYMAAMFVGVALMIRTFVDPPVSLGIKRYAAGGLNLTSSSDIDDFYQYCDDGLARMLYDDVFYLTNFTGDFYSD